MRILALLLLLCLPVLAAPLTPAELYRMPRVFGVKMSPDGRWLAVSAPAGVSVYPLPRGKAVAHFPKAGGPVWTGSTLLVSQADQAWICTAGKWKLRQVTRHDGGVDRPLLSPDGRSVAFVARVGGPAKAADSGRLFDDLFVRRWSSLYDGKRYHLFVAPPGGKAVDVTPGDFDAYPTSGAFARGDNYCWSADSRALIFAAPPVRGQAWDTNYDLWRVEVASRQRENLTQSRPAADMGPRLSPDGKRLYMLAYSRPGYESDFARVLSAPVDPSGRLTGGWEDAGVEDPSEVLVAQDGLLYTSFRKGTSRGFRGDAPLTATGSLGSLTCDRSGAHWAAVESAINSPPHVIVDGVAWDARTIGNYRLMEVPVEGGVSMPMWVIEPPGFNPALKWPVAYLVHGGPQGGWGNGWSLRWNPQVWAAQGYLVVMPNPRGSSGEGHAFQEDVSRDWGGKAYRDLMTGADAVAALPYVDATRMLAAGASYGGYMVNWFATHTDRFKVLVSHCGVWNLESMAGTTDELWFSEWEFGGPPWGGSPDYAAFSPHKFAPQLAVYKTPMLVVHNERDYRVPLNQGLELFTALQRQGVPSKLLYFPDEGHHVVKPANSVRWYREVFAFCRQYCPPGAR